MPTETPDDLGAALAEFESASAALTAAQEKIRQGKTPAATKALAAAQDRYKTAGQAYRRAKDPDRALDLLEFNRYLRQKADLKAKRSKARAS